MKLYTLIRKLDGTLQLTCEAEVLDKDPRGRPTGTHIETQIPPGPFDIGNASPHTKALALAIMFHYYSASQNDPAATAQAVRSAQQFLYAFLIHQQMPSGARLEISSDAINRWAGGVLI